MGRDFTSLQIIYSLLTEKKSIDFNLTPFCDLFFSLKLLWCWWDWTSLSTFFSHWCQNDCRHMFSCTTDLTKTSRRPAERWFKSVTMWSKKVNTALNVTRHALCYRQILVSTALGVINRCTDMIDSSDTHAVFTEYRGPTENFITWRSISAKPASACSRLHFFKYGCCCKEATTCKKLIFLPQKINTSLARIRRMEIKFITSSGLLVTGQKSCLIMLLVTKLIILRWKYRATSEPVFVHCFVKRYTSVLSWKTNSL